jgi:hypothetical protein
MFRWLTQLFGTSKAQPAAQPQAQPQVEAVPRTPRWYLFKINRAMGAELFRALRDDDDVTVVPGGSNIVDGKLRVRWYLAPAKNPRPAKGACDDLFTLEAGQAPKALASLQDAMFKLGAGDNAAVVAVLADSRFNEFFSKFHQYLNKKLMDSGGLPTANLLFTDNAESAQRLLDRLSFQEEGIPTLAGGRDVDFFRPPVP